MSHNKKPSKYHVIARFWGESVPQNGDAILGATGSAAEARALRDQWTESDAAYAGRRARCATPSSCGVWLVPPQGTQGAAVYAVTTAPREEHAAELDALEQSALRVL